ncbi:MAG: glycosyltransferase family 2 protein [Bacteroidaceae bacterium]|nr:glycosyltransferase family 2 protein [Bacteroidaceae bacterium]
MDLSILIPVHNFNASRLVNDLQEQARQLAVTWEIIVVDDASQHETEWMDKAARLEGVTVHHNEHNLGRAATRNKLVDLSNGKWLVMIDCDAQVITNDFLQRFIDAAHSHAVVCGRILHPDTLPSNDVSLRWRYEKEAESRMRPEQLNKLDKPPLRTFACLIHRSVFEHIRFKETIKDFGYEDFLFGLQLYEYGYSIHHIDNPLLNTDIEPNHVYLAKIEESIRTLHKLRPLLEGQTRQLKVVTKVDKWHLAWAARLLYRCFHSAMRRNLIGTNPSLRVLSIYKLCYWYSLE